MFDALYRNGMLLMVYQVMNLVGTHKDKQSQSVLVVCEQSQQKRCSKAQFTEIYAATLILTMNEYNPLFMMKLFHELSDI